MFARTLDKVPLCGFSSLLIKKDPLTESLLFTREGIRTPDLLVRSQTLYPAELLAHTAVPTAYI